MKIVLLSVLCISSVLTASEVAVKKNGTVANIVVEDTKILLPTDKTAASQILWKEYANKESEKIFAHIKVDGWRDKYSEFVKVLVSKARDAKLEDRALARILNDIDNNRKSLAMLPVGAYRAKYCDGSIAESVGENN